MDGCVVAWMAPLRTEEKCIRSHVASQKVVIIVGPYNQINRMNDQFFFAVATLIARRVQRRSDCDCQCADGYT